MRWQCQWWLDGELGRDNRGRGCNPVHLRRRMSRRQTDSMEATTGERVLSFVRQGAYFLPMLVDEAHEVEGALMTALGTAREEGERCQGEWALGTIVEGENQVAAARILAY